MRGGRGEGWTASEPLGGSWCWTMPSSLPSPPPPPLPCARTTRSASGSGGRWLGAGIGSGCTAGPQGVWTLANAQQSSLISCVSRPTGRRFPGR